MIPTFGNDQSRSESSGKITGSGRKTAEIHGKQKQYSEQEDCGIIPATSGRFPPERTGICPEDTEKIRKLCGSDRFLTVLSDLGYKYQK